MIVNKSMFPLQTGFSAISNMQNQFAKLQMQLGTGMKAQTLSEMGRDLPVSLSARSRLSTIEGYTANIEQVALRLTFYDNALSRMDKMEGEARNSAVQGQYGTNNINMATIPSLSKARLDEMVTMLNGDIAGRYLFGGSRTDKAPVADTQTLLDGYGGRAGFQTVVTERKMADAGENDFGRLTTAIDTANTPNAVTLAEDGAHPFGYKLSTISTNSGSVTYAGPTDAAASSLTLTFKDDADDQIRPGQTITMGFTLPDGTETQITLKASATDPSTAGEFRVGDTPAETAENFQKALEAKLQQTTQSELAAASTFAASENFFNGAGEPVLRVDGGDFYNATALRVATNADTVLWYSGESPAVSATGMGRLTAGSTGNTVTLAGNVPASSAHGFQISAASAGPVTTPPSATLPTVTHAAGPPSSMSVTFDAQPQPGEKVTFTLTAPGGKAQQVTLEAVTGRAGPGQFTIGTGATTAEGLDATTANFQQALTRAVTDAAATAEGNPRQSVTSAVEDNGRAAYGMQANESGYLRMMRSLAAMTVETYPEIRNPADPNSADLNPAKARFDAMARRQQAELSEAHNAERGSIELVTMELGIARASIDAAGKRHTDYKGQLTNLLSDVETVSKEDVAMEILALQTRLTASYQVTSMVSQLSLVNFLR